MPAHALNASVIRRYDSSDMYGSIGAIPDQAEAAWKDMAHRSFSFGDRTIRHVVVAGMGGSALGAHLISSVFRDRLTVPVSIVSDYILPSWVNGETLTLLSSYSGGTEEVLAIAHQALKKNTPMIAFCSGGHLADFSRDHGIPALVFESCHNPCGQPRIGLGYAVTYQIGLFHRLGFLRLEKSEMDDALTAMRRAASRYCALSGENPAYDLATRSRLRAPLIMASEHLTGNAHILANQWNENAKNMAIWFAIPELNHHLLEGLTGPRSLRGRFMAVLVESDLYDARNRNRYGITRHVLQQQGVASLTITPEGATPFEQAFDALLLGSYATFFEAMLQRINPTPIPWVDHFKRLMSERKVDS